MGSMGNLERKCSSGIDISILSPPRCGSHLLAQNLGDEFNFSVIYEAPHIWKRASNYSGHDEIVDFSQENVASLQRDFFHLAEKYKNKNDTYGVIEKCPSNILRSKLYSEVFYDSIIICLCRDGEEVYESLLKKANGNVSKISSEDQGFFKRFSIIKERISTHCFNGIDAADIFRDFPHYLNVFSNLFGGSKLYGPRPRNFKAMFKKVSIDEYYKSMAECYIDRLNEFYDANRDRENVFFIDFEDVAKRSEKYDRLIKCIKALLHV